MGLLNPNILEVSKNKKQDLKSISIIKKYIQTVLGGRPQFAEYIRYQLERLNKKYEYIVDIGCGAGTTAIHIATQNPEIEVLGCDIDTFFGGTETPQNFSYLTIPQFGLKDSIPKKADVIISAGVMHHIYSDDLNKFLQDIYNSLTEEGTFIIHEHRISENPIKGLIDKTTLRVLEFLNTRTLEGMGCSYNFFKISKLVEILQKNGFEILHNENTEGRFVTLPTINGNTVLICEKQKIK